MLPTEAHEQTTEASCFGAVRSIGVLRGRGLDLDHNKPANAESDVGNWWALKESVAQPLAVMLNSQVTSWHKAHSITDG